MPDKSHLHQKALKRDSRPISSTSNRSPQEMVDIDEVSAAEAVQSARTAPQLLSHQGIVQLQRTIGNQAVMRLLGKTPPLMTRGAPNVVQRMKVRNAPKASTLSGPTAAKHVEANAATQAARAEAEYGSRTFVTNASLITNAVDADGHNFTEASNVASDRYDFNATVKVSVYMKTPPNFGAGQPVVKTIDNEDKPCEIGVQKKGDDTIKVTHFKLA